MHYFLTNKFEYNFSGIEHAQCYRIDIFKSLSIPAVIVTFDFTPELDLYLYRHHLDRVNSLNMFDFYQQVDQINISEINDNIESLNINWDDCVINYYDKNRLADYKVSKHNIKSVMVKNHETEEKSLYCFDVRGFLSQLINYDLHGNIAEKKWFDNEGRLVLLENVSEKTITVTEHNRQYTSGGINVYHSWLDLKSSWLDFIISNDLQAVLYVDRGEYNTPIILNMKRKNKRVFVVLHSAHTVDRQNPMCSALNDIRKLELDNRDTITGYIASTKSQTQDYSKRTGFKTYTIPVSFVKNVVTQPVSFNVPNNIVYLSRISREKRIEDIIMAVALIKKSIKSIHLSVYGYVTDPIYNNELHELVLELGLINHVNLLPYNPNKKFIFQSAKLFVLTSRYEGFNMSMLEAAAFGIPSVSYDVLYGPSDIIHKLSNGILVNSGNVHELARKIIYVLSNESIYKKLSINSIENINKEFGFEKAKQLWTSFLEAENLLTISQNKFVFAEFEENTALRSSNLAALRHAKSRHMSVVKYPDSINQLNEWLRNFQAFDDVTLGYPSFVHTMDTNGEYDRQIIWHLKRLGVRITLVVYDSLILRELSNFENNEMSIFNMVDNLCFPTINMQNYFIAKGIQTKMKVPFELYPITQNINPDDFKNRNIDDLKKIIYTGNLDKAAFLEHVVYHPKIEVFGPNITDKMLANTSLSYRGEVDFLDLNVELSKFGGFGLVWDGDVVPGNDKESRYTKYNMPYKGISYIANEIPVIAWDKSAFAVVVTKYDIGLVLSNLTELNEAVNELLPVDILRVRNNVKRLKLKLLNKNIIN